MIQYTTTMRWLKIVFWVNACLTASPRSTSAGTTSPTTSPASRSRSCPSTSAPGRVTRIPAAPRRSRSAPKNYNRVVSQADTPGNLAICGNVPFVTKSTSVLRVASGEEEVTRGDIRNSRRARRARAPSRGHRLRPVPGHRARRMRPPPRPRATTVPEEARGHHARHQAARAADDVAGVKAALVLADHRLPRPRRSRAEQAAEPYNGARWQLQQARRDARVADRHAAIAHRRHPAAVVVRRDRRGVVRAGPRSARCPSSPAVTACCGDHQARLAAERPGRDGPNTTRSVRPRCWPVREDPGRDAAAHAEALAATAAQDGTAGGRSSGRCQPDPGHRVGESELIHSPPAAARQRRAGRTAAGWFRAGGPGGRAAGRGAGCRRLHDRRPSRRPSRRRRATGPTARAEQAALPRLSRRSRANRPPPRARPRRTHPPRPTRRTPDQPDPSDTPAAPAARSGSGGRGDRASPASQIGDPYVWGAAGPNAWDCWADHGRLAGGRHLAAALLGRPVLRVVPDPAGLAAARRPRFWGSSSSPVLDLPRRALRR